MAPRSAYSLLILSSLAALPAHALPSYLSNNLPTLFQRAPQGTANTIPTQASGTNTAQTQTQNLTGVPTTDSNNTYGSGVISNSSSGNNDGVNCSDPGTGISSNCWRELRLSQYVNDWKDTHECKPNEGFASCFTRQNGFPTLDCAGISVNSCPAPLLQPTSDPQQFYVVWHIYAINSFFTNWFVATGNAASSASDSIGDLATLIAPNNATTSSNTMMSNLARLSRQIQSNVNSTAVTVLGNHTEFSAFASQGNYTNTRTASYLSDVTNYMYYAFNTYVASTLLKSVNIYAAVARDTNVQKLVTNGTQLAYPIDACKEYDENSACDTFYYSESLESTFGLISKPSPQQNLASLTSTLLTNYTSGPLLFDASLACGDRFGGPVNVTVTAQGIQTACIGQLQIQTWDKGCHADPSASGDANKKCEFVGGAVDSGFWADKGGVKQVPAAYLGPAIAQTKVKVSRTS